MMKTLISTLFFLSLLLLGTAMVAPSFIDWNQHKDEILAHVSPYLQRQIDVAGNISFKVIPQPEIMLEAVTISNASGSKTPALLSLKQLVARIRLAPLLEGRIEVETINLIEPVLNLEVLGDGQPNWSGILKTRDKTSPNALGITAAAVQLDRVTVTDGTLRYLNQQTGSKKMIEDLNLSVTAATLLGPYHVIGDMKYQDTLVKLDVATDAYDKKAAVPIRIAFMPMTGLPQLKLNGVMDLQSGLDIQGELSVSQGKLSSLLSITVLNNLNFIRESVDMRGVLEFKGNKFLLSDIKAKFGKAGDLQGKMSVQFSKGGKPAITLDLEGSNLAITDKTADAYMDVPKDFEGNLHFKGKNIIWNGRKLGGVDIAAAFDQKEWAIKSAQLSLPGSTQVKLVGVVTPGTDSASYTTVQLTTEDFEKFISSLNLADSSIFKSLAAAGLVKKFSLSSNLELSPAKISFFNIDAMAEDKAKVSGVLNVDRMSAKENFAAKLHFSDWDDAVFPADTYGAFLQKIMQSDADMELTAKNFVKNGLPITDMTFKAKTDGQGIEIQDLQGTLSEKGLFSLKGRVASLAPVTGLDVSYALKAAHAEVVAKALDITLPPLPWEWTNTDLKGQIKGDTQNYTATMAGSVDGAAVLGSVEKLLDKHTAELTTDKIDLDKWLAAWPVRQAAALSLQAKEFLWHGQRILQPVLKMEAGASSVRISGLEGTLWGGKLNAGLTLTRDPAAAQWSTHIKGTLKQADLDLFRNSLDLKGFSLGMGDVDFDLTSKDNTLTNTAGDFSINASTLTVERFNYTKLDDAIRPLTAPPENLPQLVDNVFRKNGATIFKNVQSQFRVDKEKFSIEALKLVNAGGDLAVTGSADMGTDKYSVEAELSLQQPKGFPDLKVSRTSAIPDYTVDSKPIENFIIKNNPPRPLPPPSPAGEKSPINDILQRLDDEEIKLEEQSILPPPAEPTLIPPPVDVGVPLP